MGYYKIFLFSSAVIKLVEQQWREILRSAFEPITPTAVVMFGRRIKHSVKRSREYKSLPEVVYDGTQEAW